VCTKITFDAGTLGPAMHDLLAPRRAEHRAAVAGSATPLNPIPASDAPVDEPGRCRTGRRAGSENVELDARAALPLGLSNQPQSVPLQPLALNVGLLSGDDLPADLFLVGDGRPAGRDQPLIIL
jgi:hypothetical protein